MPAKAKIRQISDNHFWTQQPPSVKFEIVRVWSFLPWKTNLFLFQKSHWPKRWRSVLVVLRWRVKLSQVQRCSKMVSWREKMLAAPSSKNPEHPRSMYFLRSMHMDHITQPVIREQLFSKVPWLDRILLVIWPPYFFFHTMIFQDWFEKLS